MRCIMPLVHARHYLFTSALVLVKSSSFELKTPAPPPHPTQYRMYVTPSFDLPFGFCPGHNSLHRYIQTTPLFLNHGRHPSFPTSLLE